MSPFGTMLVANRGEIALRVMRTCQEKGIGTVAVYSRADEGSLHVQQADRACCVGEAGARDSYMNVANIVCAALELGADAVHPGYGFLAEDARFAEICSAHGLSFIGPSADALLLAGDKCRMRKVAVGCGVPVLPAASGPLSRPEALRKARDVGYPLVLKPRCGGGGRGIRLAADEDGLRGLLEEREVRASLESGRSFLEHCLERPRHIEVQVLADREGDTRAIGLRDCSVQRRRQKMIEEAPPPRLDRAMEGRLVDDAVCLSRASGFSTAGTVEFLVKGDDYFFIELNPRIQVEHTVTEVLTGLDLVWEQIRLASGSALERPGRRGATGAATGSRERDCGHAIQARISAEHPGLSICNSQHPSPPPLPPAGGKVGMGGVLRGRTEVGELRLPGGPGVRVDTHLRQGCPVPHFYDPLLAKVIVWAPNRAEALIRLRRALGETHIGGVETNLPMLEALLGSAAFEEGCYHTGLLEELEEGGCPGEKAHSPAAMDLPGAHAAIECRVLEKGKAQWA
ncbi:MAG: acetyl-CoA carboxylase biotin carboxylase subunit [Actinobacteria bacterium]|nr:acetyl-CoA carboxylase biotin carboxylase subunit [Actinomycetota bacterium]MBU4489142.1 acetyl-CoA carboxylase biotin carboxylase subunit [Actinomycetota bacterium]MCG2794882.1 acetyl-CoA carboxylase biotin carboxylase subunit [Actinomycetes bacterium]